MTPAERVQALQLRYIETIDDGNLEAWPALFSDPCHYRVTHRKDYAAGRRLGMIYADSHAMLRDRVASLLEVNIYEGQSYRHIVNPPRVDACESADGRTPGEVRARTAFIVARIMQDGTTTLFATGVYLDIIELSGPQARFREKIVVLDSPVVDTLLALPL